MSGTLEHVINHGGHGAAFENGFARPFCVIVWPGGLNPGCNLKMLVLQGVSQLVGHDHALIIQGNPIRYIKLPRLGIVESGNLLGQQIYHEVIQIESFGYKTEGFRAACPCVTLGRVLVLIHLANHEGAYFFPGSQSLLHRRQLLKSCDFTDLLEYFIRSGGKLGIVRLRPGGSGRGRRCLLRAKTASIGQEKYGQEQRKKGLSAVADGEEPHLRRIADVASRECRGRRTVTPVRNAGHPARGAATPMPQKAAIPCKQLKRMRIGRMASIEKLYGRFLTISHNKSTE